MLGTPYRILQHVVLNREGAFQGAGVAHQDAAGFVRLEQPLVRVGIDGVRPVDALERRRAARRQDRETTIGRIDVKPHPLGSADVRQGRQRLGRVQGEANVYVYGIDNFIFGDLTNEIVDTLRILNIRQGDRRFVGFDARGSLRLGGQVWATLGLGYVNATLTTTGEPLPRIPPLRGTLSLDVPLGRLTISPDLLFAGRQDRVFRDETETGGYSVVNLDASYVWPRQHLAHVVSFTAYHLTNALYRNHTSFIKDLAQEMGRGVRMGYSLRFF